MKRLSLVGLVASLWMAAWGCTEPNTPPGSGGMAGAGGDGGMGGSQSAVCGDGVIAGSEVCDDGNIKSNDGCSGNCLAIEDGFMCTGSPSACSDADECATNNGGCDKNATCTNTLGSRTCVCNIGFGGDGLSCSEVVSVAAGKEFGCVLLATGFVKCWGRNSFGGLGLGEVQDRGDQPYEMGVDLPAIDLGTNQSAKRLALGGYHGCVVLESGDVKCWGKNGSGQLGQGDTTDRGRLPNEMGDKLPVVNLGAGNKVLEIDGGYAFTCALLTNGNVKCWGDNGFGQLGLGDWDARGDDAGEMGDALPIVDLGSGKTATAISAGGDHACALLTDGTVKCWGAGIALGLGDGKTRGDESGEMGDALPAVNLGAGKKAVAISAGYGFTCALLEGGQVKCWGSNFYGQLGLGDAIDRGDDPNEMGDALPSVDFGAGQTVKSLDTSDEVSCVILQNDRVKCWGNNASGQAGLGDTLARGGGMGEMGDKLSFVDVGTGKTVRQVQCSPSHVCARLQDNSVKCWGNNGWGQLGLGDTEHRGDGPNEMGDALPSLMF